MRPLPPSHAVRGVAHLSAHLVADLYGGQVLWRDEDELPVLHVGRHLQQQLDRHLAAHRIHCNNNHHSTTTMHWSACLPARPSVGQSMVVVGGLTEDVELVHHCRSTNNHNTGTTTTTTTRGAVHTSAAVAAYSLSLSVCTSEGRLDGLPEGDEEGHGGVRPLAARQLLHVGGLRRLVHVVLLHHQRQRAILEREGTQQHQPTPTASDSQSVFWDGMEGRQEAALLPCGRSRARPTGPWSAAR